MSATLLSVLCRALYFFLSLVVSLFLSPLLLLLCPAASPLLFPKDEEAVYFCSSNCYMQFALAHRTPSAAATPQRKVRHHKPANSSGLTMRTSSLLPSSALVPFSRLLLAAVSLTTTAWSFLLCSTSLADTSPVFFYPLYFSLFFLCYVSILMGLISVCVCGLATDVPSATGMGS